MSSSAILMDTSRCTACRACQVACKCWNSLPSPLGKNANEFTGSYQSPLKLNGDTRILVSFNEEAGGPTGVKWAFGRVSCQHCINPACASACPSGAIYVDEETGLVTTNEDKCIGCQYCSAACPFSVPKYHSGGAKINKCTGCIDRIEQGREPACVQTCQPGALQFGDRNDLLKIAHDRVELLKSKGYEDAAVYGENELEGLGVISVAKFGLAAHGLIEEPKVNDLLTYMGWLKPLTGLGMAAMVGALGLSFLTARGYKRNELHYDEENHVVFDVDTGKIIKRIDEEGEE